MLNSQVILEKLKAAVFLAGQFIRTEYLLFDLTKVESKGKNDLVSYVDKETEAILIEHCRNILPEAGFINEESGLIETNSDFVWIIDPLDGTTNFIQKIPIFSISVGLMYQNKIILGVVYEINRDEMFSAVLGQGAHLNNIPISIDKTNAMKDCVLATGFPYTNFYNLDEYLMLFRELLLNSRGMRRLGSAAVDLCYTACGRFGGFFEGGLNAWDVSAGTLIVQEAGGIVTDFTGGDDYLFGKNILAGSVLVHETMLKIVKGCFVEYKK